VKQFSEILGGIWRNENCTAYYGGKEKEKKEERKKKVIQ
jgi:hypothetical protein